MLIYNFANWVLGYPLKIILIIYFIILLLVCMLLFLLLEKTYLKLVAFLYVFFTIQVIFYPGRFFLCVHLISVLFINVICSFSSVAHCSDVEQSINYLNKLSAETIKLRQYNLFGRLYYDHQICVRMETNFHTSQFGIITADAQTYMNQDVHRYLKECLYYYKNFEVMHKGNHEDVVKAHDYLYQYVCLRPSPIVGRFYTEFDFFIVSTKLPEYANFYEFRELVAKVMSHYNHYAFGYTQAFGLKQAFYKHMVEIRNIPSLVLQECLMPYLVHKDLNYPVIFHDLKFRFNDVYRLIPADHPIVTQMAQKNMQSLYGLDVYDPRVINQIGSGSNTISEVTDFDISSISWKERDILNVVGAHGALITEPLYTRIYNYFDPIVSLNENRIISYNGLDGSKYEITEPSNMNNNVNINPHGIVRGWTNPTSFPYSINTANEARFYREWASFFEKIHQAHVLFVPGPDLKEINQLILGINAENRALTKIINSNLISDTPFQGDDYSYIFKTIQKKWVKHFFPAPTPVLDVVEDGANVIDDVVENEVNNIEDEGANGFPALMFHMDLEE